MRKHIGKVLLSIVIALVVLAVAWRFWRGGDAAADGAGGRGSGGRGAPVAVQVSGIERRDLQETRSFTGTLEAESRFDVNARLAGRLMSLEADIGDRVRRGQVVARLEDDEFVQQLRQAEAEKEMAEANLAEAESALLVARRELERARVLRERQIAAEADLEMAEAEMLAAEARLKVARATVAQRTAALETERLRLSYTEVRATWQAEGEERAVAERHVTEGSLVSANEALLTLVDLRTLRAVIFVTERDFPFIRPGQSAQVSGASLPGRSLPGRVARIAPVFQAGSRQARVEIEVGNEEELLNPGMFARIRLQLRRSSEAIALPIDSVVRRDGRDGVFLVEENRARFVPVELGIRDGDLIEVLSPSLTGRVVTLGQNQLTDGAPVQLGAGELEAADGGAAAGE